VLRDRQFYLPVSVHTGEEIHIHHRTVGVELEALGEELRRRWRTATSSPEV
jgi:hypothetical protein